MQGTQQGLASSGEPAGVWRRALPTAVLGLLVAALYALVLAGMARTWWTDKNASHGFLVPAIAGFLAWPKRGRVRAVARTWTWGLAVLVFGLLLYPAGLVAGIEFLPEVSFVVTLGGLMLYLLGPAASRQLAFPYAFLWFMVPWPDTLVEFVSFPMQLFSAKYAAMLAGLAGMAVRRDGVDIHLRSYTFSVGVPCSGMRSLVALLALSALVAYLSTGPLWKRRVLFVAGLPLAMLANVGRIVCILAIASIWSAKAAEGFFHGFSGIVVFLFATLGLLATGRALGLRYQPRELAGTAEAAPLASPELAGARPSAGRAASCLGWRPCALPLALVLLTLGLVAAYQVTGRSEVRLRADLSRVPLRAGEWQGQDLGPLDRVSAEMLRPDAFMDRAYVRADGYPVDVTVVFGHAKETFHSPGFCLLGGGWNVTHKGRRSLNSARGGQRLVMNEFALQRQDERRVVLYWYASHREATPSWVIFQWRLLRNRLLGRPTGGALVRVTAPVQESQQVASQAASELIGELYQDLRQALAL